MLDEKQCNATHTHPSHWWCKPTTYRLSEYICPGIRKKEKVMEKKRGFIVRTIQSTPIHFVEYDDVHIFWNEEDSQNGRGFSYQLADGSDDNEPLDFDSFLTDQEVSVPEFLMALSKLYTISTNKQGKK